MAEYVSALGASVFVVGCSRSGTLSAPSTLSGRGGFRSNRLAVRPDGVWPVLDARLRSLARCARVAGVSISSTSWPSSRSSSDWHSRRPGSRSALGDVRHRQAVGFALETGRRLPSTETFRRTAFLVGPLIAAALFYPFGSSDGDRDRVSAHPARRRRLRDFGTAVPRRFIGPRTTISGKEFEGRRLIADLRAMPTSFDPCSWAIPSSGSRERDGLRLLRDRRHAVSRGRSPFPCRPSARSTSPQSYFRDPCWGSKWWSPW